jgi:hypothetical protein
MRSLFRSTYDLSIIAADQSRSEPACGGRLPDIGRTDEEVSLGRRGKL